MLFNYKKDNQRKFYEINNSNLYFSSIIIIFILFNNLKLKFINNLFLLEKIKWCALDFMLLLF